MTLKITSLQIYFSTTITALTLSGVLIQYRAHVQARSTGRLMACVSFYRTTPVGGG
jgi:hypothetical protein